MQEKSPWWGDRLGKSMEQGKLKATSFVCKISSTLKTKKMEEEDCLGIEEPAIS